MATRKSKDSAITAGEMPVTRAMFGKARTELLARIDQAREEARADTTRLDAKIDAVKSELKAEIDAVRSELKAEFHELKAEFHELKAEFHEVKAEVHGMRAQMSRIEVLVEEQNARNKVVLDGIVALLSRQNQVEQRVTQVEDTVRALAAAHPVP